MNIIELKQTNWANNITFTKILACKSKYNTQVLVLDRLLENAIQKYAKENHHLTANNSIHT